MSSLEKLLAEVRELDRVATPVPWRVGAPLDEVSYVGTACDIADGDGYNFSVRTKDAAFISRARTLLPKLAEIVEVLCGSVSRTACWASLPVSVQNPSDEAIEALQRAEEIAKS